MSDTHIIQNPVRITHVDLRGNGLAISDFIDYLRTINLRSEYIAVTPSFPKLHVLIDNPCDGAATLKIGQ